MIKILVKFNFKDLNPNQLHGSIVIGVHMKNNCRVEIVMNNSKVYQVLRNKLGDFISKELLPSIVYGKIGLKRHS